MAIAFRSNATGSSVNATTSTISLPAGTTTGDVTILFAQQATSLGASGPVPVMTAPAGWAALVTSNGIIVCWRAYQAGDPTTGITFTSNAANWWESLAVTYSGCDTTAPIDVSNSSIFLSSQGTSLVLTTIFRAPSVCPNFNSSVLLTLYSNGASSSGAITVPSGVTSRASTSIGPGLLICDKPLTDGTPTGDIDTTRAGAQGSSHFGMSLALKTAGATGATLASGRATFGGFWNDSAAVGTFTVPLDHLNVQNGDLTIVIIDNPGGAATPPSGWTQLASTLGAQAFYRTWATGDPQTPAFAHPVSWGMLDAVVLRRTGSGTANAGIDTSGVNTGTSGTVATPVLTPATGVDLLLSYFGARTTSGGTWSGITAGLNDLDINTAGPGLRFSSLLPSGSPTTAYSATWSGGGTIDALALLISGSAAAAAAAQARAMVMA